MRSVTGIETGASAEAARVVDLTPMLDDDEEFAELLASGALDTLFVG